MDGIQGQVEEGSATVSSSSSSSGSSNEHPVHNECKIDNEVAVASKSSVAATPATTKTVASVQPVVSSSSSDEARPTTVLERGEEQLSDSLSLLKDTLPGFKGPHSPVTVGPQPGEKKEEGVAEAQKRDKQTSSLKEMPSLEEEREEESSDSDIDEDALSIIIAVEGEDEELDYDMSMEVGEKGEVIQSPVIVQDKVERLEEGTGGIVGNNSSENQESEHSTSDSTAINNETESTARTTAVISGSSGSKEDSSKTSSAQQSKQSAKVKQFFTTLQMFGNKTSQEVADQVQELITALVNDLVTVEEFHQEIQRVTNHPMKEFVVPFLKENLAYFRDELKSTSLALSDILGTTPKSNAPAVAPEISEQPDLIVVHSTKPSAPVATNTIVTAPSSPLRAPANLTSMSVPPATIHEPQLISPTKIESVINASVVSNNRKRPRDLVMGNGGEERDISMTQRLPKRSRPIPTATLTPEPLPPVSSVSSQVHHAPSLSHAHHSPSHTYHTPSHTPTGNYYNNKNTSASSVATPITEIPTGVAMMSVSSNQHVALINQVKEDWNHLETMLVSVEGMVVKTQKALSSLKERIQQIGLGPSPAQLKAYEAEIEQRLQQKMEKAIEEIQHQAAEEKQRILLDATKQMRDTLKEMSSQSNSKESCWNCGRKATETCSGCNKARYCGSFCQHKDWDRHMKQCAGARPSPGIRVEKERTPVQIATAIPHNHAPIKPPTHYITGSHPPHPSGPSYIRTASRTPTPTSYAANSEIYVPLHADIPSNGSNTLTATSTGVAVVTINRTPGDLAPGGINMI